MIYSIFFIGIIILLLLLHLNSRFSENYWKKRGVKFHGKNTFFGPLWDYLTTRSAFFEVFCKLYKEYPDEPAIGIGSAFKPTLYVKDPENIQYILQTAFYSFNHRGLEINEGDVLAHNILLMNGIKWKVTRQSMTPLFTAAKLKSMYYITEKSAKDFVEFLLNNPELQKVNTYDTLTTYCSAAIGASVFGITTQSVFDSPFLEMAKTAISGTLSTSLKFSIASVSPWLTKVLQFKFFGQYEHFFISAVKQMLRKRESENVKRHDFADLCVTLQKNGIIKDEETGYELNPTDDVLAAQAFFFFIAGVEPTATLLYSTLYELGKNPDILQRLHNEIDAVFEQHDGQPSYDVMIEMKYMDKVLNESLRMYPPIGFLTRKCIKDSVLPVGNIKVDKGTKIFTPIFEIHRDEKYYPNPDTFDPERFSNEARESKNIADFMPFGKGNRLCIGDRYARIQAKAGLAHVLRHFTVRSVTSKNGIKFSKEPVQVRLKNIDVQLIPRHSKLM